MAQRVKNPPAMQEPQETRVQSLSQEDPLEEEMTTHSSTLAWETPWTEDPGGLQPMGSQRVRHDWAMESYHACVCVLAPWHSIQDLSSPTSTPAAVEEQCVHHVTTTEVPIIQDFYCPTTCLFPLMAMGFLGPVTSLYITGSSIVPGTRPEGNAFCWVNK